MRNPLGTVIGQVPLLPACLFVPPAVSFSGLLCLPCLCCCACPCCRVTSSLLKIYTYCCAARVCRLAADLEAICSELDR